MKKKELQNLAKKIAKWEIIIQTSDDPSERQKAQNEIMHLSSMVHDFEEIDSLDEMVQEILNKNLN